MTIRDRSEYEAAAARAHALSDAPEGSPQADELARLIVDLKAWDDEREGGLSHGPEAVDGLTCGYRRSRPCIPISSRPGIPI